MYNTLEQIKKHLNIDTEFVDDDNYLMLLEKVAEDSVERHIDHSLADLEDDGGQLPPSLNHAVLFLVGTMYANRESVTYGSAREIPTTYNYILDMFKDYSKREENGGTF